MIRLFVFLVAVAGATVSLPARAVMLDLFDWAIHVDGTTVSGFDIGGGHYVPVAGDFAPLAPLGATVDDGSFSFGFSGGLGTLKVRLSGAGPHNVIGFFDHEFDEPSNTYFNENAAVLGSPASNQSWEADDPDENYGDIFANVSAGTLDNTNSVSSGGNDVSMAMGFDFSLGATEQAVISFVVSSTEPVGLFAIQHTDPDSDASIYFYSSLEIRDLSLVPAPAALTLVLTGIGVATARRRRR